MQKDLVYSVNENSKLETTTKSKKLTYVNRKWIANDKRVLNWYQSKADMKKEDVISRYLKLE
jgi:hypothetical protein